MAHVVSLKDINQFLPKEKLQIESVDEADGLDHTAKEIVVSKLRALYDTTNWTSTNSIPVLVRTIMAMLTAGWIYDRQYADNTAEGDSYGARRVREAYALLDGIVNGVYELESGLLQGDAESLPSVLETDPVFTIDSRH